MNALFKCPDVFAVVVTFNPDLRALDRLLRILLPQVGGAIIVDNGATQELREWHDRASHEHLELHQIGENRGIAAAQNIGCLAARLKGARFVLFSDQDSEPAEDMVHQLRRASCRLEDRGIKVAAVGPRYLDMHQSNVQPFMRASGLRLRKLWCSCADLVIEVDYVIASGCLVRSEVLEKVGSMREEIFIDYVDVEWCLRAGQLGFRTFGVCAAEMSHEHGDRPITVMGKQYLSHSPLRHYYRFRNAVWLYKQRYVPLRWKLADGIGLMRRFFFYSFFARPRGSHFRMMIIGLFDGMRSRLGRFDLP